MILEVYLDSRGIQTVGCGHKVLPIENLKTGDKISLDTARRLFRADLEDVEKQVNKKIKVPLYQHEYDALVDIAFNAGAYAGLNSIAEQINKGDYSKIPQFIKKYRTGGGNEKRRNSEAQLFESGIYSANH